MESWTVFRYIRRVIFIFLSILGLFSAGLLSFYVAKVWIHATTLQRSIILAMICVNFFSSLLLYLMAVVVFKMWKELLRVLSLIGMHTVPAVLYTLYGSGYSCAPFDTQLTCNIVRIFIFSVAWSYCGILVLYTVYLCIMSCIPRPFPLVTPNELLSSSTLKPIQSNTSSFTSATGLLSQFQTRPYSPMTVLPPSRSPSLHSQAVITARSVPKKLFVANADPSSITSRGHREQRIRHGGSYGAMGSPDHPRPADLISFSPAPSAASQFVSLNTSPHVAPRTSVGTFGRRPSPAASVTARQMEAAHTGILQGALPLGTNPFMGATLSRNSSPMSFHSSSSSTYSSSESSQPPFSSRTYGNYLSPYASYSSNGSLVGIPTQLQPGSRSYPIFTNPFMSHTPVSKPSTFSYPGTPLGVPPSLTSSSASVHSLVPSIHLLDTHPGLQYQVGVLPADTLSAPPTAHIRTPSDDPLWRPYSAGARMTHSANEMLYKDVRLPNPYTTRAFLRFSSFPHIHSGRYSDAHRVPVSELNTSYAAPGILARVEDIAQSAVAQPPSWREMVMRAATSG